MVFIFILLTFFLSFSFSLFATSYLCIYSKCAVESSSSILMFKVPHRIHRTVQRNGMTRGAIWHVGVVVVGGGDVCTHLHTNVYILSEPSRAVQHAVCFFSSLFLLCVWWWWWLKASKHTLNCMRWNIWRYTTHEGEKYEKWETFEKTARNCLCES